MATVYTHAVVGLGLARLCTVHPKPWAYWGLAVLLPIVPDLDVFVPNLRGGLSAHRGITHSLLFALLLSMVVAGIACRHVGVKWRWLTALLFALLASHGLLDAMTNAGARIPFFWPFGNRYGHWGPLPPSDLAYSFPAPRASPALQAELTWTHSMPKTAHPPRPTSPNFSSRQFSLLQNLKDNPPDTSPLCGA